MGFRFKQFYVRHDQCAMKVGTDGILLGAWATVSAQPKQKMLDLGTGSGLIALMLAQRSADDAVIDAVELDHAAYRQAKQNFHQSPWQNKLRIFQDDMAVFCRRTTEKYHCIVANPPYFQAGVSCRDNARDLARYHSSQGHIEWLKSAEKCLAPCGQIHFILPYTQGEALLAQSHLFCAKRTNVLTKPDKHPSRMLLSFQAEQCECVTDDLMIYDLNNQYSQQFKALTAAFYLAF